MFSQPHETSRNRILVLAIAPLTWTTALPFSGAELSYLQIGSVLVRIN